VYITLLLEWGIVDTHKQECIRYSHHHRAVRKCEKIGKAVKGKRKIHKVSKCRPTAKKQQGKHCVCNRAQMNLTSFEHSFEKMNIPM